MKDIKPLSVKQLRILATLGAAFCWAPTDTALAFMFFALAAAVTFLPEPPRNFATVPLAAMIAVAGSLAFFGAAYMIPLGGRPLSVAQLSLMGLMSVCAAIQLLGRGGPPGPVKPA
jgi:hypothetical protein